MSVSYRPIRTLAIVNRGEAAMRCLRGAKALAALEGEPIRTVALFTEPDRNAPFVRHADAAVELPVVTTPVASYLDHDGLVAALKAVGADAVWPGWGFVAEDAAFVERLASEGIRFLGPTAQTMRELGDKIASKLLAESADVPVTKWSGGAVKDFPAAREAAERIGFPLVVKASAGGGGRGIRMVHAADKLETAFTSAGSEALSAFGDGRLFLEAMVQGGRHIEVQIAADQHGTVLAVGCRDCSVQRRHQKVIEEAPPPGLSTELIEKLESSARSLAASVGYSGVGTVEFLVRGEEFFFLEMNPRLQVEHGITEQLTGVDLVAWQIRIGRGEKLPEMVPRPPAHSIEVRVCAEDPDAGFLPAPGKIVQFDPALGPGIRIDTGVVSGSVVPAAFDSLIAKVITTGTDRNEARTRMVCALMDTDLVIEGGATNRAYLLELLQADDFTAGAVDTLWLDRWNQDRSATAEFASEALAIAGILSYQSARAGQRVNFFADPGNIGQDRIPPSVGQEVDLAYQSTQYRLRVFGVGAWRYRVHLESQVVSVQLKTFEQHSARVAIGGRDVRVVYDLSETTIRIEIEGRVHSFGRQTAGQVRALAPSMLVTLDVAQGDRVEAGQQLGLLEAMKMEIGFDAPVAGTVTEVRALKGQQLAAGDVILVIDAQDDDADGADEATNIRLPEQTDPLALLFNGDMDGRPDLARAALSDAGELRGAMVAATEEARRILLGYDANPERVAKLIEFLEARDSSALPESFLGQLSEIRAQIGVFADIEQLFTRAQSAGMAGTLGASNDAMLRLYVRRIRADGAGLPQEFLDMIRQALSHYSVDSLEHSDAIERAVLRLFASQQEPNLRFRLMTAILRRVKWLAPLVGNLEQDAELQFALSRIAGMRGRVPHALADLTVDTAHTIFERPALDREAERTTKSVESVLGGAEPGAPREALLADLALAPSGLFKRIEEWLVSGNDAHRAVAFAAYVRRLYAPLVPLRHVAIGDAAITLDRLEFSDGPTVLATLLSADDLGAQLSVLRDALAQHAADVAEVVLVGVDGAPPPQYLVQLREALAGVDGPSRVTLSTVAREAWHETLERDDAGDYQRTELYGLHPQTAERVELYRYSTFDLKRLSAPRDTYCFVGTSLEMPEDERMFVMADIRGRPPGDSKLAHSFVPLFERAFHDATRTLRMHLSTHDPRRRLQWNRITLFLHHDVVLDTNTAELVSRRLHPSTRHLGLERVSVRLRVLEGGDETAPRRDQEVLISDVTGKHMEIVWREPGREPLVPVSKYVRAVVAAKRRGLIYPYELIRMLTTDAESGPSSIVAQRGSSALPLGSFEEYDIEPEHKRAVSAGGRAPGLNESSVVFGIIKTPTAKFPEGMRRVLILSDPTRGMGSLAAPECERVVAAIDLAEELRLPVEWVPVSSGARIAMDSGTENLDATARVVRRIVTFTQSGGTINIIVSGVNVGAQSYWDALATMLMHTRGVLIMTPRASMVLTGKAALAASGSVAAEDEVGIGGYERVMGPNGQAQYYAEDLADAFRILYRFYDFTYVMPGESRPRPHRTTDPKQRVLGQFPYPAALEGDFAHIGDIFDVTKNPGRKRPFAMRALMSAVIDQDGGHLERWHSVVGGETAIVWDAHLGGHPVCMIGIESQNVARWGYRPVDGPKDYNGGTLFPQSSKKVARALNSASGNRAAVIIANLSGFDGSPESLRKLQLEYGAEIARAVVNFEGPILFLVVSRYHGGAYVVFSRELNSNVGAFAVEGSFASVIGGGPAAKVVFTREVRARVSSDPRVVELTESIRRSPSAAKRSELETLREQVELEMQAAVAQEFDSIHTVERAMNVGSLERIVGADEVRPFLIEQLSIRSS